MQNKEKAGAGYKPKRSKRKYRAIAKIQDAGGNRFVKYRTNNPENFILFAKRKFSAVLWINFYHARQPLEGSIYATWGKYKGLIIN